MSKVTDAQTFVSEIVDDATGIRVRVEIVVPEEQFSAEVDWSKLGATLTYGGLRNEFRNRVHRVLRRAIARANRDLIECWIARNPEQRGAQPRAWPAMEALAGTYEKPGRGYPNGPTSGVYPVPR